MAPTTAPKELLVPTLCHPHVHLDKPYILTCNHSSPPQHPDYSDLAPSSGDFKEALAKTSAAKERYTEQDLYLRGSQLIADSYRFGVTAIRGFVEVDHVTETKTLRVATRLKEDFEHLVELQICMFAQDPVFSGDWGDDTRRRLEKALDQDLASVKKNGKQRVIDVLGTTPYVESSYDNALRNIQWAIKTAQKYELHVDFHLDYTLDTFETPHQLDMLSTLITELISAKWTTDSTDKTVCVGHCTRLTALSHRDLVALSERINTNKLPIHFVGLPTSDIYMMGRPTPSPAPTFAFVLPPPPPPSSSPSPSPSRSPSPSPAQPSCSSSLPSSTTTTKALPPHPNPHSLPRGTLQIPSLIKQYNLSACIGVNNMGNAFTPYGTGDPLQLACWGVGLYHAGTVEDAKLLLECVGLRARRAIFGREGRGGDVQDQGQDQSEGGGEDGGEGGGGGDAGSSQEKRRTQLLMIKNDESVSVPASQSGGSAIQIPARQRINIQDIVWDPPETRLRSIVWADEHKGAKILSS